MDDGPRTKVFISYSHADKGLVTPVVQLLRSLPFPVFRDQDGIAPGEVWEERLIDELEQATHVLVFWCSHSATSEWVDLEADLALEDSTKIVVPVCLDDTPLPSDLASRQAVDLRALATSSHGPAGVVGMVGVQSSPVAVSASSDPPPPKGRPWLAVLGSLAAAVLVGGVGIVWVMVSSYSGRIVETRDTPGPGPLGDEGGQFVEPTALDGAPGWTAGVVVVTLALVAFVVASVRRSRRARRSDEPEDRAPISSPGIEEDPAPPGDRALDAAQQISAAFERIAAQRLGDDQ